LGEGLRWPTCNSFGEAHLDRGLGDIEDDEMFAVLYRQRAELLGRSEGPATSTEIALSISGSPTMASAVNRP